MKATPGDIRDAADRIWEAVLSGTPCAPVRDLLGEVDLDAAYGVQRINTQRKIDLGHRIIGAKIGLTSFAVQQQLGVDQPDFGVLSNQMLVREDESVPMSALMQAKVEAEIAFIMGKDLDEAEMTMDHIKGAIDSAATSIEIVGSRIRNWDICITDTIADNASSSHFVLGKVRKKIDELDLEGCGMSLLRGEDVVSTGKGRACLGNPLNAVLWLAQTFMRLGSPLRAGDIVLAGALGPMVSVMPGDRFLATIDGLDSVSVSFGHE